MDAHLNRLHPLKRANLRMWEIFALDHLLNQDTRKASGNSQRNAWYREAKSVYQYILSENKTSNYFPLAPGSYLHTPEDIRGKLKLLEKIYSHAQKIKVPSVDMRTLD